MKLIFGFRLFVAAVAITGGLYLIIRKPAQKKTDLEKLENVCRQIVHRIGQLDDYLARIYTTTLFRIIPSSAAEFPHDGVVIAAE